MKDLTNSQQQLVNALSDIAPITRWEIADKILAKWIKKLIDESEVDLQKVFTDFELCREILNKVPDLSGTILVVANLEFVYILIRLGVEAERISFVSPDPRKRTMALKLFGIGSVYKYNDILGDDDDMPKFDVVVGNPPYTQGSKPLYALFFEKALDLGSIVAFIFPIELESNNKKLKTLNVNIKRHSSYVSRIVSDYFDVSQPNIRYVIASRNINNKVDEYVDPLTTRDVLYPDRCRLKYKRGSYEATVAEESKDGVRFIRGVLTAGIVEKIVGVEFQQMLSEPFVVLVNYTMAGGRLQCAVVENTDVMWSYTTFAIPTFSKPEADAMCEWLTSEEVGKEMVDMMKIKKVYSFSGPMLGRLPTYK